MINLIDESSKLKKLILGIADDIDFDEKNKDKWVYDPKTKFLFENNQLILNSHPYIQQIEQFASILKKNGVSLYRPSNIKGLNQIFVRDTVSIIEDKVLISNIIPNREYEIKAIINLINQLYDNPKLLVIPQDVKIEGGDVILYLDHVFVGCSYEADVPKYKGARTNMEAVSFMKKNFPNKKIIPIEMNKKENEQNVLHLDCCFNILRNEKVIIYKKGFKNIADIDFIINLFGSENIFEIDDKEMYHLNSNLFSISPNKVCTDVKFVRLNEKLLDWGFDLEKIDYSQISKLGGLFRCSTLPLERE